MSERKAINKWYPPDYDPSKAPKKAKKSNANEKVRLMLPFSMKCLQCNEYIAARRKFNARKEVTPDRYMGIKIIKFHIKCPRCNNGIVFKTDPKLAGFVPVEGGVRNYESATEVKIKPVETEDEIFARLEREDEENQKFHEQQDKRKHNPFWLAQDKDTSKDSMANLEDKLVEQQKEQEMHDHLAYLQAKAQKLQQSGGSEIVAEALKVKLVEKRKLELDNENDEIVKELFARKISGHPQVVGGVIKVKRRNLDNKGRKQIESSGDHRTEQGDTELKSGNPLKSASAELQTTNENSHEVVTNSSSITNSSKSTISCQPTKINFLQHESLSSVAKSNIDAEKTTSPAASGLSALAGYSSDDDD